MNSSIESFFSVYEIKQSIVTNKSDIYFIAYLQNEYSLWVLENGGNLQVLLRTEDELNQIFYNSKRDQLLVEKINEKNNKLLFDFDKEGLRLLTEFKESQVTLFKMEEDQLVCYRNSVGKFEVFVYNLATNVITNLFELDDTDLVLEDVHNSTGHFLISRKNSKLYKELGIYSVDNRNLKWLINEEETAFQQLSFLEDHLIQGICNLDSEFFYYFQYCVKSNTFKTIASFDWDVEGYLFIAGQKQVLVSVNENGISKLYLYNLNTSQCRELKNVPYGVIKILPNIRNDRFYFTLESPARSQNIWEGCYKDNSFIQKTEFVSPNIIGQSLPETITIQSFDQTEVSFYYYESSLKLKEKPLLFYLHGGPESQMRPSYMPFFSYLQTKGFDICVPNIRGSAGYGKRFLHLDDGEKRMDILRDIEVIRKWCMANKDVNEENLFIMGRSYGGYATLKTITHQPGVWRAAVSIAGMSNLKNFLLSLPEKQRRIREMEYGSLSRIGNWLDEVSPLHKVHEIECPLMMIHGKKDFVVPYSEATNLVNALQQTSKYNYEFLSFQEEGHHIRNYRDVIYSFERIHAFFKNYLIH